MKSKIFAAALIILLLSTFAVHGQGVTVKTECIEEELPTIEISLKIPVLVGDFPWIDAMNRLFARSREYVVTLKDEAEKWHEEASQADLPCWPYEAVADYEVMHNQEGFLSLVLTFYEYTGGAHGMTYRQAYNIELVTGRILVLEDLFMTDEFKESIAQRITQELTEHPDGYFITEFKAKDLDRTQPFYLKEGNLVVFFGLYEIAPYAAGMPSFSIPLKELESSLRYPVLMGLD